MQKKKIVKFSTCWLVRTNHTQTERSYTLWAATQHGHNLSVFALLFCHCRPFVNNNVIFFHSLACSQCWLELRVYTDMHSLLRFTECELTVNESTVYADTMSDLNFLKANTVLETRHPNQIDRYRPTHYDDNNNNNKCKKTAKGCSSTSTSTDEDRSVSHLAQKLDHLLSLSYVWMHWILFWKWLFLSLSHSPCPSPGCVCLCDRRSSNVNTAKCMCIC